MPHISEKTEMLDARLAMTGAITVATWLGLNPLGSPPKTAALAFGMAAATLFPALTWDLRQAREQQRARWPACWPVRP